MAFRDDCDNSDENEELKGFRIIFVRSFWPGGGLENAVSAVIDILKKDICVDPVLVVNGEPKGKIPDCEVITLDMGPVGDLPLKGHPLNIARYLVRMLTYAHSLKDKLRHDKLEVVVALEPEMAATQVVIPQKTCRSVVTWIYEGCFKARNLAINQNWLEDVHGGYSTK